MFSLKAVQGSGSLLDTGWWGADDRVVVVVEGGVADPADHDASGEQPASHVTGTVH